MALSKISRSASSPKTARLGLLLLFGTACIGTLGLTACSSKFSSCTATRTCPALGGGAGEAGESEAGSGNVAGEGDGVDVLGGNGGEAGDEAVAGSSGVEPTAGTGGAIVVDTTPPQVDSITPVDGAKGVKSDAKIVVTFSEPVDRLAAQEAITTSAGSLAFSWNAASTVVTATPSLLAYATGASATTYTVQVSTGLRDIAGNHSTTAFNSSFSTLRQLSLTIIRQILGTRTVTSDFGVSPHDGDDAGSSPSIGDTYSNGNERAFPDFNIESFPAVLTTIVSAKLSIPIAKSPAPDIHWDNPFATLGDLQVDHIYDFPIAETSLNKPALSSVGTLMSAATPSDFGIKTIDVTAAFTDDYVNRVARGNHSMYRLQFAKTTDNDATIDAVAIPFSGMMSIDVVYLIP